MSEPSLSDELRALRSPERYENDRNGNWWTTDMEYGWDEGIEAAAAAIESEARATPGLDVKRLARAMAAVWPVSFRGEFASDNPSRRLLTDYAERIAAEYDRLATPEPDHD